MRVARGRPLLVPTAGVLPAQTVEEENRQYSNVPEGMAKVDEDGDRRIDLEEFKGAKDTIEVSDKTCELVI